VTFFDQMTIAVETYPVDFVDLEIVDVAVPGNVLNTGETGHFKVKITNRGPLHLNGVKVHVSGANGVQVKDANATAPFVADFVSQAVPRVDAHGGSQTTTGTFSFKAPSAPQTSRTLVSATLDVWDATLDHILNAHSDPVADPRAIYEAAVAPL